VAEIFTFKPRDDELEWIHNNVNSWSHFCHDNIYKTQRKNHYDRVNKFTNHVALVIIGCILLSVTYILYDYRTWLTFFIGGLFFLVLGFYKLAWEVKKHTNRK
jgi:hypothetical protein